MKVTIIYGNTRHGSTWNCVNQFMLALEKESPSGIEVTAFHLPTDQPSFCAGCFSCFINGEQTCPHAAKVMPIRDALAAADLIILASPVYGMDVSGQMKTLLDYLCYMWLSHRPNPAMFGKVGLVIATTAGAGLKHTARTMTSSLKFWGVKRIYVYKKAVSALSWQDVDAKRKRNIKDETARLARRTTRTINRIERLGAPFFVRFMFAVMKGMMKKNTWNPRDRQHWENLGWLAGSKPF